MEDDDETEPTDGCKALCQNLLNTNQPIPQDSLFNDDLFKRVIQRVRNRNETRVTRDLAPTLTPSAEILFLWGAIGLKHLFELNNESWYKSIPLVHGPRPQPDFCVGLKPSVFSSEQLTKLQPAIGGWQDTSRVVAKDEMYFPFFTAEVKCGNEGLTIADRQNAHSAAVAVNAVVELYRLVSRQDELNHKILAFSISHDDRGVRIYGHYPVIKEQRVLFYRHHIKSFDFTSDDGEKKWSYKFAVSVFKVFYPIHLERVRSAIDQLPDPEAFEVPSLSQQSDIEGVEQDYSELTTSDTQPTSTQNSEPVFKKPRGKGRGKR